MEANPQPVLAPFTPSAAAERTAKRPACWIRMLQAIKVVSVPPG